MLETTSKLAEKLATSVSRRGFLGLLGQSAGAAALGLAGILTSATTARADPGKTCCVYRVYTNPFLPPTYCFACVNLHKPCPASAGVCGRSFLGSSTVAYCHLCG